MISFLKNLFLGGLGSTVQGVSRGIATFTGDKVQREGNIHEEQMAVSQGMAAEYQYRGHRTWFDALVDGLNRIPRPLLAFEAIALPHWAIMDPVGFSVAMQALALMPEWLAIIFGQVVLLFFGGRMLDRWNGKMKGPSKEEVQQVLDNIKELKSLKAPDDTRMAEEDYQSELKDTTKPMSNEAIMEWNRRRSEG